jgi:hypothetical protein
MQDDPQFDPADRQRHLAPSVTLSRGARLTRGERSAADPRRGCELCRGDEREDAEVLRYAPGPAIRCCGQRCSHGNPRPGGSRSQTEQILRETSIAGVEGEEGKEQPSWDRCPAAARSHPAAAASTSHPAPDVLDGGSSR